MAVYLFIFIIIFFLFVSERMIEARHRFNFQLSDWKKTYTFCTFLVAVFLILIAGFRGPNIGVDHFSYTKQFYLIKEYGSNYFSKNGEYGFILLNKLVAFLGGNEVVLCLLVACLVVFSYLTFILKNTETDYYIFSMLVFAFQPYFFIQSTFNILRQGCGASFLLFAFTNLNQKKYFRFVLFLILAGTMHRSSLFFIFLLVFKFIHLSSKKIKILAFTALVFNIFNVSEKMFILSEKFIKYGNVGIDFEPSVLNVKPYILLIMVFILFLSDKYSLLYESESERFFVDLFVASIVFLVFALQNDILYRFYITFAMIAVPGLMAICKNMKKKMPVFEWVISAYYCCFYLGYIFMWHQNGETRYYPYVSIFS